VRDILLRLCFDDEYRAGLEKAFAVVASALQPGADVTWAPTGDSDGGAARSRVVATIGGGGGDGGIICNSDTASCRTLS
jgi:hypothetical protein